MDLLVEYSKSNRATCRLCTNKIEKDVVRVGQQFEHPDYGISTKYFHLGCWNFKKQTRPEDFIGFNSLKPEDLNSLRLYISGTGPAGASGAATSVASKRKAIDDVAPSAKAPKTSVHSSAGASSLRPRFLSSVEEGEPLQLGVARIEYAKVWLAG